MAAPAPVTATGKAVQGTPPPSANRWRFWVGAAAVFLLFLWLLNDILLPFVVGIVVAYFLDPRWPRPP